MSRQQRKSIPVRADVSFSRQENTVAGAGATITATRRSQKGFCSAFGDCMTKPVIVASPPRQSNSRLELQVPFVFDDEQIALQVGEGKIRPALPEHDENIEDLIELIQLAWDEDPEYRPSFATITRGL